MVELGNRFTGGTKSGYQYRSDMVRRWERSCEPYTRDCLQRWDCYGHYVPIAGAWNIQGRKTCQKKTQRWIIWQDKGASEAHWDKESMHPRVQRNYLPERKYWEPAPLTKSHLFSLFHPFCDYQCFGYWLVYFVVWGRFCCFCLVTGFCLFLAFDAQGRHSFQDYHHRHDERSTGAKKKYGAWWMSDGKCVLKARMVLYWNWSVTLKTLLALELLLFLYVFVRLYICGAFELTSWFSLWLRRTYPSSIEQKKPCTATFQPVQSLTCFTRLKRVFAHTDLSEPRCIESLHRFGKHQKNMPVIATSPLHHLMN